MGAVASKINSVIVENLVDYWIEHGVDSKEMWSVLGLDPDAPLPLWIETSSMAEVFDRSSDKVTDPLYPFSLGVRIADSNIPLQRIITYANDLKSGISALNSYSYLYSQSFYYVVWDDQSDWIQVSVKTMQDRKVSVYQLCIGLVYLTCLCQKALGYELGSKTSLSGSLKLEVPSDFAELVNLEAAQSFLGLDISEGSDFVLVVNRSLWNSPTAAADVDQFKAAQKELIKLDKRYQQNFALYAELQKIIESCLLKKNISLEIVSEELGISVRNLQRRLHSLGTSYQHILDASRKELTMKLLLEDNKPVYEIAFLVGYTEPSAFYKAFRRWTGTTPGSYAKQLLKKG